MKRRRFTEPGAVDVLEEAAHLLRTVPAEVHATYLFGTVPFLVGLLFFVGEMSRGVRAAQHLAEAALGMTLLFGWMKAWQAVAAGRALAHLGQHAPPPVGVLSFLLLFARQIRVHAFGLVLIPVALVATVPFGWVFAYFQSATVLGFTGGDRLHRESVGQARRWQRQNHFLLALMLLMALVVFLNVAIAIYAAPSLLRSILGAENLFSTVGWNPLNTTFLSAAGCVAFLIMDPFCKAVYVLRCFYGASRRTGVDLLVRIRGAAPRGGSIVALAVLIAVLSPIAAGATESPAPAQERAVLSAASADLDGAIEHVLGEPRYAWKLPRVKNPDTAGEAGIVAQFFQSVMQWIKRAGRWIGGIVGKLLDFFFRPRDGDFDTAGGQNGAAGLIAFFNVLLPVLAVVLVVAVVWLAWRWWSHSRVTPAPAGIAPVVPLFEREEVTADELPEDEWMRLARELLAKGETRQALRALFLGSLAALGAQGALVLSRHKSNRDYERELARRGPRAGAADLAALYADNRRMLERAWYGWHPATPEIVERFQDNVRQLRSGAP